MTKLAQIFEFHFNPRAKEEEIFESFLFEPTNILERKLGSLYIVGHLSKALPQNLKFLEKLSSQIKKKYYFLSAYSPEKALKDSLGKANEFLADEVQKGNVSWLGNLNLAICSFKDYIFNFTLVDSVKIFLLRGGKIIDIGKNLELQDLEPWPLKIFGNIVSGKLSVGDKILILTQDIFSAFAEGYGGSSEARRKTSEGGQFFSEQNLFQEIIALEPIEDKKLKSLIKNKEKLFAEISGIFLLIDLTETITGKEKIAFEKRLPVFSIWQTPHHFLQKIISLGFARKIEKRWGAPISKIKLPLLPKLDFPKYREQFPLHLKFPKIKISPTFKRNSVLIIALILLLFLGSFFAKLERGKEETTARNILEKVQSKIDQAENALIFKDGKRANLLYQEAWQEVLSQTKADSPLEKEALELKTKIEEKLFSLNQLEKIGEPEILLDFEGLDFIPQKAIYFQGKIYFFSPAIPDLYQFSVKDKKGDFTRQNFAEQNLGGFIKTDQKFNLAALLENKSILLYLRPDKLFSLKDNQLSEVALLKVPYPDFYFNSFANYKSNLYFLDGEKGEIVKFLFKEGERELSGSLWLNQKAKKPVEAKSLAVDGTIWILTKDNSIERYSFGNFQEALKLDLFPYPKNFSKILTSPTLPYFYLLEPVQNRIVILSKSGQIIKQFQSEKFDNLKDFAISDDGKTIYLLNGLKIYQISI